MDVHVSFGSARASLGVAGKATRTAGKLTAAALFVAVVLVSAGRSSPPVEAAFHIAVIDEVMFGYNGDPNQQFVEVRLLAAGQNITTNSVLGAFNAAGTYTGDILVVSGNVSNSATNAKWIMATPQFAAASGITPNFTFAPATLPATGMVCWGAPGITPPAPGSWNRNTMANWVDCVPYGGYAGSPIANSPATPFGLGDGLQSLTRLTHTDNTAADFALACPTPQSNTGAIGYNHDNHIDLPPSKVYDDLTWANSDLVGDNCGDTDDDNDGLTDAEELALPGPLCPSATGPTDPLKFDTDGDRVIDLSECSLGSNPVLASSVPPAIVAPDADNDGVPNAFDAPFASIDSDVDGLLDVNEFRHYGTNLQNINTDGDLCNDSREVASINADNAVNVVDIQQMASVQFNASNPGYIANFDYNKNGSINVADLQQAAARQGNCP